MEPFGDWGGSLQTLGDSEAFPGFRAASGFGGAFLIFAASGVLGFMLRGFGGRILELQGFWGLCCGVFWVALRALGCRPLGFLTVALVSIRRKQGIKVWD